jgi:hypothetical protein
MKTRNALIEHLVDVIDDYSIIINDYINKDFIFTYDSEYLEEEIKVIAGSLLETIDELKALIY